MNIFVEGLQGMGKSTLLQKLSRKYPEYHVYHEGDYCPIELAWCTYMTQKEYEEALSAYPMLKEEMMRRTYREGDRYIMEYTRILTDVPGFHRDMERFEIYNGRKNAEEFLDICGAAVCKNLKEVRQYFDECGADISGMSNQDLAEAQEVFALPDGRYLVVEG